MFHCIVKFRMVRPDLFVIVQIQGVFNFKLDILINNK